MQKGDRIKMMKRVGLGVFLCVLMLAGMAQAQTFVLDLDASTPAIDQTRQVAKGATFKVNLVVTGAEDLLGVSADVLFDATSVLELTDIESTFGDLDFSGIVGIQEIASIISAFINGTPIDQIEYPAGVYPGILLDKDRSGVFGITEVADAIGQFVRGDGGTQYWTTLVSKDADRKVDGQMNESVSVFDPVAKSNAGGEHPGLIEDITAVLLRRPEANEGGAPATGFGYDAATYGPAIVCTMTFKVKNAAPTGDATLNFGKSVFIDELFQNIDTDIQDAANQPSTIQVQ